MVISMTGFGKATGQHGSKKITIEIRSLNSKSLDLNTRLPQIFREKESDIRNRASASLKRGKVDLSVYLESESGESSNQLNSDLIRSYHKQLKELSVELGDGADLLPSILRFPEILQSQREELSKEFGTALFNVLDQGLLKINEHRLAEGQAMEKDLRANVASISDNLKAIEPLEEQRLEGVKERLMKQLEELKDKLDSNRFEQELIYYLEKFDINEEKVRLRKHCSYFLNILDEEESQGKKLGFIAQEMGREINTIGSKANHADIQKHVVQMKDDLERIKEQVLNVL